MCTPKVGETWLWRASLMKEDSLLLVGAHTTNPKILLAYFLGTNDGYFTTDDAFYTFVSLTDTLKRVPWEELPLYFGYSYTNSLLRSLISGDFVIPEGATDLTDIVNNFYGRYGREITWSP